MAEPVIKRVSNQTEKETNEEEEPIRSIFCLKRKEMMREIEEEEDCFILEFDPSEEEKVIQFSKLSLQDHANINDEDVVVIAEKGQVACRDFPHPRYLCAVFPFGNTPHHRHCPRCYCSVCDKPAPCSKWTLTDANHCDIVKRRIYCSDSDNSYSSDDSSDHSLSAGLPLFYTTS